MDNDPGTYVEFAGRAGWVVLDVGADLDAREVRRDGRRNFQIEANSEANICRLQRQRRSMTLPNFGEPSVVLQDCKTYLFKV